VDITSDSIKKYRILAVDDQEDILEVLSELLDSAGHEIDTLNKASKTLEQLSLKKYDLVISDLVMDEMTGWELADEIYKNHKDIKIMIMSGYGCNVGNEELQEHHVSGMLNKPFGLNDVLNAINNVMGKPAEGAKIGRL
jgi:DNA-binding NtrC family response regulator